MADQKELPELDSSEFKKKLHIGIDRLLPKGDFTAPLFADEVERVFFSKDGQTWTDDKNNKHRVSTQNWSFNGDDPGEPVFIIKVKGDVGDLKSVESGIHSVLKYYIQNEENALVKFMQGDKREDYLVDPIIDNQTSLHYDYQDSFLQSVCDLDGSGGAYIAITAKAANVLAGLHSEHTTEHRQATYSDAMKEGFVAEKAKIAEQGKGEDHSWVTGR